MGPFNVFGVSKISFSSHEENCYDISLLMAVRHVAQCTVTGQDTLGDRLQGHDVGTGQIPILMKILVTATEFCPTYRSYKFKLVSHCASCRRDKMTQVFTVATCTCASLMNIPVTMTTLKSTSGEMLFILVPRHPHQNLGFPT